MTIEKYKTLAQTTRKVVMKAFSKLSDMTIVQETNQTDGTLMVYEKAAREIGNNGCQKLKEGLVGKASDEGSKGQLWVKRE